MNNKPFLYRTKGLRFSYSLGNERIEALKGIDLDLESGKIICLSGPSGSGKSTLLHLLGLIEEAESGELYFGEEDLLRTSNKRKNEIRRYEIGFIFQTFHLIPVLTAEENVAYFLRRQGLPKREIQGRVEESLLAVGLDEQRKKRPGEMSGGQRQRVAIARAFAKHPQVIIADEPTASLDQKTGREVMAILKKLVQEKNVSVILASHDPMVLEYLDEVIPILDGQIQGVEKEGIAC